jgi:hypothetical protein
VCFAQQDSMLQAEKKKFLSGLEKNTLLKHEGEFVETLKFTVCSRIVPKTIAFIGVLAAKHVCKKIFGTSLSLRI